MARSSIGSRGGSACRKATPLLAEGRARCRPLISPQHGYAFQRLNAAGRRIAWTDCGITGIGCQPHGLGRIFRQRLVQQRHSRTYQQRRKQQPGCHSARICKSENPARPRSLRSWVRLILRQKRDSCHHPLDQGLRCRRRCERTEPRFQPCLEAVRFSGSSRAATGHAARPAVSGSRSRADRCRVFNTVRSCRRARTNRDSMALIFKSSTSAARALGRPS